MSDRDDWPDGILERDLDATAEGDGSARRDAERVARDTRNMNALLAAMGERLGEGVPAAEDEAVTDGQVVPLRHQPVWRRRVMVGLAAAAAIAALMLATGEEVDQGSARYAPAAPSMVSELEVEADGPFAVFPTSDPDIAVVWLLNLEESE